MFEGLSSGQLMVSAQHAAALCPFADLPLSLSLTISLSCSPPSLYLLLSLSLSLSFFFFTLWFHLPLHLPHPPGYWSTNCRLSAEGTITRWRRYVESCRMSKRRTTVSSSFWPRTSSCPQRPESKPVCNTRSLGSPTRTWYAAARTRRYT